MKWAYRCPPEREGIHRSRAESLLIRTGANSFAMRRMAAEANGIVWNLFDHGEPSWGLLGRR